MGYEDKRRGLGNVLKEMRGDAQGKSIVHVAGGGNGYNGFTDRWRIRGRGKQTGKYFKLKSPSTKITLEF